MSSPLPPQPGETDEQKKARLAGAYRKQAEVDAERRAEEAARGRVEAAPVRTEMPRQPKIGPDREQKMTPIRRAAGGAAKVRKGMMTSEGVITNAMNKIRGK